MTLKEAELFFKKYGCTGFFLSREEPERYSEYAKLKISKAQETTWRREEIHSSQHELTRGAVPEEKLWASLSYLSALVVDDATADSLRALLEAVELVAPLIAPERKILVAENLFGTPDGMGERHGPVTLARTLGESELLARLLHAARFCLAEFVPSQYVDQNRYQRILRHCEEQIAASAATGKPGARDYLAEVEELGIALGKIGMHDWQLRLQSAVEAGATGTEIAMAVRHQLRELLAHAPELDEALRAQARGTVNLLDELLR